MYLALYRKYRPSTFDDVISQEHITTTLKNQIATGQIAHAYLFTGTRGTGKTSCAKIMAKAVNCLSPVNGNPCGECKACRAIAEGSTDIIEIDAASNNGVDSIRQIRDEVIYTPIDCKYKVYIIDEVHMLSDSAFNALLKTLEEPPEHAVFILATTEYYKVPATILSRCQQFLFSKIDPEASKKRLLEVAKIENISLTENAAALIARLSDGAMRDAWSLLDQCISSVGGQVDEEAVRVCSGVADSGYLFSVTEAVIERRPAQALKLLDELIGAGKDILRFTEELTLHYRNIMLAKSAGTDFIKGSDEELERYREQSGRLSLDEIMRQVDLVSDSLDNINRMKQTGQGRLLAEQLLIRLCTPNISRDAASLAARIGALENRLSNLNFAKKAEDKAVVISQPEPVKAETAAQLDKKTETDEMFVPDTAPELDQAIISDLTHEQGETQAPEIPPEPAYNSGEEAAAVEYDEIPLPEPPPLDYDSGYIPPPNEPFFGDETDFTQPPKTAVKEKRNKRGTNTVKSPGSTDKAVIPTEKSPPKEENGVASETDEPKEKAGKDIPIPESGIELPADVQPLPQWDDITEQLPVSSKGIMKKAKAFLYGGRIYVEAQASAQSFMKNGKKAEKLRDAVKTVMGAKLDIFALPEKTRGEEEKEDLVTPFLERAREMGIKVKIEDK